MSGDSGNGDVDVVGLEEAARLLEVTTGQVQVMVQEGLLTPVAGHDGSSFLRAEVMAVREMGG